MAEEPSCADDGWEEDWVVDDDEERELNSSELKIVTVETATGGFLGSGQVQRARKAGQR